MSEDDHAGDTQQQFADIQTLFVSAYHVSRDMSSARSTPERPSIYITCQPLSQEPKPTHRTARAIVTGALVHSSMSTGKLLRLLGQK